MVEFYLRWAMKEAYTKALGLGLHLEFSAFETRLCALDDKNDDESGECLPIWSKISKEKQGIHLSGRVIQQSEETYWNFYFLPLFCHEEATGCACVCFGPVDDKTIEHASFQERISWTTLDALIQYHS
jgi:phosphopantetheinyl transferase